MKGQMKLNQALRNILEESIDHSITKKLRLRTDAEDRLQRIQTFQEVTTTDLIALFRGVLDIQRQQDSIAADRYNLLRF
jgi:hypothetical protein